MKITQEIADTLDRLLFVELIPVLVLTVAAEFFDFCPVGETDMVLPVCSGDMLFNAFNEYLGFLNRE